jgi:uncharacterized protein with ATP-grasp and redox domains
MYAQYECVNCVCDHAQKIINKLFISNELTEKESFDKYMELLKHLSNNAELGIMNFMMMKTFLKMRK